MCTNLLLAFLPSVKPLVVNTLLASHTGIVGEYFTGFHFLHIVKFLCTSLKAFHCVLSRGKQGYIKPKRETPVVTHNVFKLCISRVVTVYLMKF